MVAAALVLAIIAMALLVTTMILGLLGYLYTAGLTLMIVSTGCAAVSVVFLLFERLR